MTTVGIIGGLGPESTIDYYRRILAAWEREDPSTAPSIVVDSLDVRRALRLVESDRPALIEYPTFLRSTPRRCTWPPSSSVCGQAELRNPSFHGTQKDPPLATALEQH